MLGSRHLRLVPNAFVAPRGDPSPVSSRARLLALTFLLSDAPCRWSRAERPAVPGLPAEAAFGAHAAARIRAPVLLLSPIFLLWQKAHGTADRLERLYAHSSAAWNSHVGVQPPPPHPQAPSVLPN